MLIKYENLTIRNATTGDAKQLATWWNDGTVMAHAGFPKGLGTSVEEVTTKLLGDTDETHRRLIMESDSVPIGEMNYRNMGEEVAEIGIKICDGSMQNHGLGKMLLSMLITALFEEKGYRKIILDTNKDNTRAQHVYESLGFKKVQVRENSWKNQLGEWQSAVDYELVQEDFISYIK